MNKRSQKRLLFQDRLDHYRALYPGFKSPVDFLLMTMNRLDMQGVVNEEIQLREQLDCARTLVGFECPKLNSVEVQQEEIHKEPSESEKIERLRVLLANPALSKMLKTEDESDE